MMTEQRHDDLLDPLDADLAELHDDHIWLANAAVAAGRDDLAWEVAQEFPDAALALLARSRG